MYANLPLMLLPQREMCSLCFVPCWLRENSSLLFCVPSPPEEYISTVFNSSLGTFNFYTDK